MPTNIRTSLLSFLIIFDRAAAAYEQWSSAGIGRPEVNRRAIAGIWKLTPKAAVQLPMKEFTVYPKKPKNIDDDDNVPELLLMLKEDGSFQQYSSELLLEGNANDEDDDANHDIDSSWSQFKSSRQKRKDDSSKLRDFIKGTWDFLDGNLILAADRPDEERTTYSRMADGEAKNKQKRSKEEQSTPAKKRKVQKKAAAADTLLKGRVVANYQTRLQDNPALAASDSKQSSNVTSTTTKTALDTHLSVPKGSINIGKFFYPKNHPSFFEQPMFQPVKKGSVTLRQILGSLNTEQDEDKIVEKYQRSDFYNKTFLLTSHPIGRKQPKGNTRWSIKHNKFVEDPPNKKAAKAAEEANKRAANIRVMQVAFHANNTFSTTAGLGGAAILRGKFDIVGQEKDQLWMQVIRFGFGRSVSGSVYSEGRALSHEDAKAYWGTIKTPDSERKEDGDETTSTDDESEGRADAAPSPVSDASESGNDDSKTQRLEVSGSVLDGWGLEPIPVARFILKEVTNEVEEEEDDEDDEEEDFEALSEEIAKLDPGLDSDGIDWSDDGSSFQ